MSDADKPGAAGTPRPGPRPEPQPQQRQAQRRRLVRLLAAPLRVAAQLIGLMAMLARRVKVLAGRMMAQALRVKQLVMPEEPPPGPFRRSFWRSPVRGPWLTSVLGLVLLVGVPVVFVTGLLSYAAYNPNLGGQNDYTPGKGWLGFYLFSWPSDPDWLYRFNQGLHVTLGLALVPILLAKLWSVLPRLFEWPPLRSPAHLLERVSLFLLVGGGVFEFATGILDIQQWYVFPGSFYTLHFYGGWIFVGALVVHVSLKMPTVVRSLRRRRLMKELRVDTAHTEPEPADVSSLVPTRPAAPTISRRGVLGFAGAGGLLLAALAVGQSIGGPLRRTALLAPHGQVTGNGPLDFQINVSAKEGGITAADTGDTWRLSLIASPTSTAKPVSLTRAQLLAMPQHTASLAINCVEGWSSGNQVWTGVRLRDLARLAGVNSPGNVYVQSLQDHAGHAILSEGQVMNPDSLLAFRVNGVDLDLDHGYPARVILPASPGVHNIKWVTTMTFGIA